VIQYYIKRNPDVPLNKSYVSAEYLYMDGTEINIQCPLFGFLSGSVPVTSKIIFYNISHEVWSQTYFSTHVRNDYFLNSFPSSLRLHPQMYGLVDVMRYNDIWDNKYVCDSNERRIDGVEVYEEEEGELIGDDELEELIEVEEVFDEEVNIIRLNNERHHQFINHLLNIEQLDITT